MQMENNSGEVYVLFVCTGNTCRSVIAQGLFTKMWSAIREQKPNIRTCSAGLNTVGGLKASREALEVLQQDEGLDLREHRSRKITADMVNKAHYILTMTGAQKEQLLSQFPGAAEKVWVMGEFAYGDSAREVADPFGSGVSNYRLTAAEIKAALERVVERIFLRWAGKKENRTE